MKIDFRFVANAVTGALTLVAFFALVVVVPIGAVALLSWLATWIVSNRVESSVVFGALLLVLFIGVSVRYGIDYAREKRYRRKR